MQIQQSHLFNRSVPVVQLPSYGITLIEIMLILILLAIGTALVSRIYSSTQGDLKPVKMAPGMLLIDNAMKFYKLDNGFYPTNQQGLKALVTKPTTKPIPQHWKPYLKSIPLDNRGKPYRYSNPGDDKDIKIYSEDDNQASSWWDKIKF